MTANMLDMEPEELEGDGEIKDLLSEISNIVGGNLKSALNDEGLTCVLSTPSMTYGGDFTIKSLNMERFERFVFIHQQDWVVVEVGVKTQQGGEDIEGLATGDSLGHLKDVDVEKVNAIDINAQVAEAVSDVFDTMFSLALEPTDSVTSDSLEGIRSVGAVSLAGDVTGMISIHVSNTLAREMAAEMLGMGVEEIEGDDEIRDMLGEVGNIVGGSLKSSFTDAGLTCVLSTPSYTTGRDFKIEALNMAKYERFAFKCNENFVFVELGIKICELAQIETQQGKDIHYSVDDNPAAEEDTSAATEDHPETEASASESVSQSDIDALLSEAANQESAEEADILPAEPAEAPPPVQEQIPDSPEDVDLGLLLDIPLEIKVELGRAKIQIQELLNLSPGSAVKLIKLEGEPVDILANDTLIARGEVVVQHEKYGIRVTEITSRLDRIRSFGL
jgi:flagellar motor switch protein FliN